MSAVRLLAIVALALLATACGGDGPSTSDAATVKVMLRSSAEVGRVVQPLFVCLPRQTACYRQAGPPIVDVVEREREAVDRAAAETDNACLREAATLFGESLDAYGDAGRAASTGDVAATQAAISKTTQLEIAYTKKFGECGFVEGRLAEYTAAFNEVSIAMLRLDQEIQACTTEACFLRAIQRGKTVTADGLGAIDGVLAALAEEDDDVPACLPASFRVLRDAYQALLNAFTAVEESRFSVADREGTRAANLGTEAQEDMAACLSSAGL